MKKIYDVLVIGTGPAGTATAFSCAKAGLSVAIADRREYGGTCPLRGCDPKKILHSSAELKHQVDNLKDIYYDGDIIIDWKKLIHYKREYTKSIPDHMQKALSQAGVKTLEGVASFIGEHNMMIGDTEIEANHIVLATGAKPRNIPIPGFDLLINSSQFMELEELPSDILFLGGGYIGMEFANIAAMFGSKITVLEAADKPLAMFDNDLVDWIVKASENNGIQIVTNNPVKSIERKGGKLLIKAGDNGQQEFETLLAVNSLGRIADFDDLNLNEGNIELENKNIRVDKYLRSTSNPSVYVVGDANSHSPQLTPVAAMEGNIVAKNIIEGIGNEPDYSVIPSAVYTLPPSASVGITEKHAEQQKLNVRINKSETTSWFSSWKINEPISGYKVIIDNKTNNILGAHLIGKHCEELINLFAFAMKFGITSKKMADTINSYPTMTSNLSYMIK